MRHGPSKSGVCVVRIERQRRGMLITLRIIPDVTQVSTVRVEVVADIETALKTVREFLVTFAGRFQNGDIA